MRRPIGPIRAVDNYFDAAGAGVRSTGVHTRAATDSSGTRGTLACEPF